MCAAARLAKMGHSVRIFENSNQFGGKCRTERISGYSFDTGPSLLTLPAVYKDFFLKTGDPLDSVLTLQPVNPSFDYRFADGSAVQFSNLSRLETLKFIELSFGKDSKNDWDRLMKRAEQIWDVSRGPFIESELNSMASLLRTPTLLADLRTIAPWKSLHAIVNQFSNDYRLQYIVDRYATYSGSDPRRAPAALLSIAFVEEAFGAWHVQGGFGQLARAIKNRACELGVLFHFDTEVIEINQNGRKATGVTLEDGTFVAADVVVANADASLIYANLLKTDSPILKRPRKSLKKSNPSLAGFSLLLGLRPDAEAKPLEHHTILFPDNYDAEFNSIFTLSIPATDPTIYICSPKDLTMVEKPGHQAWTVLVNAPRHSTTGSGWDWSEKKFIQEYAQGIITHLETRGIAIRGRLDLLEIRTPADLERETMAPGGTIYGTSSNGASSLFRKARNRSPLPGLFCVGGSSHPGGGLPLVGIGAEIVAKAIGRA